MDIGYQLTVLILDVLALIVVGRRQRAFWWPLAGMLVAGVVSAALFAGDAFHALRLVSWLLFLHAPIIGLCAFFIAFRRRDVARSAVTAVATLLLSAFGVYAFLIEPHALRVTRYEIESVHVQEPVRIAVLADLQTDDVGSYEEQAFRMAMEEQPDLVLFLGDYVQVDPSKFAEEAEKFRNLVSRHGGLKARLGSFAVQGNIDPSKWAVLFGASTVTALGHTTSIELNDWLVVTGLDIRDSSNAEARVPRPRGRFHIVFGHMPDYALGDVDADLLLAGHTHGGQVQIPFLGPILTLSKVPRAWASGETSLGRDKTLLVSRGIGMERGTAPRLRFLCSPEVMIVDLRPLTPANAS